MTVGWGVFPGTSSDYCDNAPSHLHCYDMFMASTRHSRRPLRTVVAFCTSAALLASCGAEDADTGPANSTDTTTSDASASFPVTIDSAVGKATITEQPERIVTLGWGSADAAAALGTPPVGIQEISDDTGDYKAVFPWNEDLFDEQPELLNPKEIPYERIAALEPDVILAVNSGITDEEHDRLSTIAPTVGYPGTSWQTGWEQQTRLIGTALGRPVEADRLVEETRQRIDDVARTHPEFTGRTVAFVINTTGTQLNEIPVTDARYTLLRQLGFDPSPSAPDTADSFSAPRSLETFPGIDADVLVAWHLSDSAQRTLENQPTFGSVPAVARGGYTPVADPLTGLAVSTSTVLSIPWVLDRYADLLSDAALGHGGQSG